MTAGKDAPLHVHVAIDCQSKSNDNAGTVVRERNCTVTLLTKKAYFNDEESFPAFRRTT